MTAITDILAKSIDFYDAWYDGIAERWQRRFDRFCRRVEELVNRAVKTATIAITRCLEVCRKAINE